MIKAVNKKAQTRKRHQRVRVNLAGTASSPRLAVYRSTKHIYAQLIDDEKHETICSASSIDKDLKEKLAHGGNIDTRILFVTYAGITKREADWIREQIEKHMHFDEIYFKQASPAIAVNSGPGTFGLLYMEK